jgi:anaerobic magnesium-protoporphyrin IX monomethyl ester cyclase
MRRSIALVYPYFRTAAPNQQLFPPLGIASLTSQMRSIGLDVTQVDCTFKTFDEAVADITKSNPSIVGIYVMVTMRKPALRLLEALKRLLPEALFVTGGPLPTLYPERFADRFDIVFRGEADLTFPSFCKDYLQLNDRDQFRGSLDLSEYPGLFLLDKGETIQNPALNHPQEVIDSLPIPDRSDMDHRSYQDFWQEKTGGKMATIMATRGCCYNCDFCSKPIFGNVIRKRSIGRVMEEIRDIATWGYDHLWIADDSFTLDLDYVEEFCRAMIASQLGFKWSCLSRVGAINEDIIDLMKRAGCTKVYLGLESGSDRTLRLMKKGTTVEEGIRAVHLFNDAGIRVGAFFIVGYPGETSESIDSTFKLALSHPFDEISFNVPFPLPGSALFSRVGVVSSDQDWEIENEVRFVYRSEFDEGWLRKRINDTMDQFTRSRSTITSNER